MNEFAVKQVGTDQLPDGDLGVIVVGAGKVIPFLYESVESVQGLIYDWGEAEVIPLKDLTFEKINALPESVTREALIIGYVAGRH